MASSLFSLLPFGRVLVFFVRGKSANGALLTRRGIGVDILYHFVPEIALRLRTNGTVTGFSGGVGAASARSA